MVTITRDIDSPPESVLAVLADGWSYAIWVVGTSRVRGPGSLLPKPVRSALLVPRNTETLRRLAMSAERRPVDPSA